MVEAHYCLWLAWRIRAAFSTKQIYKTRTNGYSFRALFCRVSSNFFFLLKISWTACVVFVCYNCLLWWIFFCFNNTLSSSAPIRRSGMFWSLLVSTIINYCIVIMSVDINNCDNIFCNSIFGAVVPCVFLDWKNIISWPSLKLFSTLFLFSFFDGIFRFYFGNQETCCSAESSITTKQTSSWCLFWRSVMNTEQI